jgi:hypothetical protein
MYAGINAITAVGDRKWDTQSITLTTMGLFGSIEQCWRQTFLEKHHSTLLTFSDSIKIQKRVLEDLHQRLQTLDMIRKELESFPIHVPIPAAPPPPAAAVAPAPAQAIGLADAKRMAGPSFRSQFGFPVIPLGFEPVVGPIYGSSQLPPAPPKKMDLTGGARTGGRMRIFQNHYRGTVLAPIPFCLVHRLSTPRFHS